MSKNAFPAHGLILSIYSVLTTFLNFFRRLHCDFQNKVNTVTNLRILPPEFDHPIFYTTYSAVRSCYFSILYINTYTPQASGVK